MAILFRFMAHCATRDVDIQQHGTAGCNIRVDGGFSGAQADFPKDHCSAASSVYWYMQ